MKKSNLIPQYLQDELSNLVKQKDSYTKEEIDQLRRDYDYVIKQRKQLKEAEKYGAISKDEAAVTNLVLMVKLLSTMDNKARHRILFVCHGNICRGQMFHLSLNKGGLRTNQQLR